MRWEVCLCAVIPRLETRTRIVLLMHYRETKATTNTGRLATLALPHSEIRVRGEKGRPLDWEGILVPSRQPLFLYPDDDAELLTEDFVRSLRWPVTLIVPDGTWRQAAKVGKREAALKDVPRIKLPAAISEYRLRKSHGAGVSTIEAIAGALGVLEGPEVETALRTLFHLMVDRTLATRSPPAIAARGGLIAQPRI